MLEIKNTKELKTPYWHDIVYGAAKTGKTTFAGTWPDPLVASLDEDGILSLRSKGIDYVEPISWVEILSLTTSIRESKKPGSFTFNGKEYKTLVIDPLNMIYDFCLRATAKNKAGGGGIPSIADYGLTNTKVITWVRELCRFPFHVLFTCLERMDKCEYTGRISVNLLLSPGVGKVVPAIVSHIFHTTAEVTGAGKVRYQLATQQESYYPAGGRYEHKPLPARVEPDFAKMYAHVNPTPAGAKNE